MLLTTFCLTILLRLGSCIPATDGTIEEASPDHGQRTDTTIEIRQLDVIRYIYELPAIVIGKGQPDRPLSAAVVGVRKEGSSIKAQANDVWHLGSDTKAMTATTIALLVQTGAFSWSTTLGEVLPNYNVSDARRGITVEELAAHRSGIPETLLNDISFFESLYNMSALAGRRAITNRVVSVNHNAARGEYMYANENYVLLGAIIDYHAGMPAEDALRHFLFAPLGMQRVGFGPNPEPSNTSLVNPWPHVPGDSGPVPVRSSFAQQDNPPGLNTAGRAHMPPEQWNKFLQVHLQGPLSSFGRAIGLSAASWNKLHTAYPETNKNSAGYGYTYGAWVRQNYSGNAAEYILYHDGSNNYNYATALVDLKANAAFLALSNVGGQKASEGTNKAIDAMRAGVIEL